MTAKDSGSAEHRLYEAMARWDASAGYGPEEVIDAACQALIDGLDSQALRELAGASAKDSSWDIRELVSRTQEELAIPEVLPPGSVVAAGGGVARRRGIDTLRLAVEPVTSLEVGPGFQVLVHVNGVEMTSAGAGLGMDPYDVLVPTNRLAGEGTVPIARCPCGVYGCSSTDITITRDADVVHWDWSIAVPMHRGVSFPADQYDAEVTRAAEDHSWETPVRTAGRLVLTGVDRERLLTHGLRPGWVANDYRDDGVFRIALHIAEDYQVFVDTPWLGRGPEDLAREVCATLARPPQEWPATWHAVRRGVTTPPVIAGPSWRIHEL